MVLDNINENIQYATEKKRTLWTHSIGLGLTRKANLCFYENRIYNKLTYLSINKFIQVT